MRNSNFLIITQRVVVVSAQLIGPILKDQEVVAI